MRLNCDQQPCWPPLLAAVETAKDVTVAVSSDRGLCGGLNSNIAKYTRALLGIYAGSKYWFVHFARMQRGYQPYPAIFIPADQSNKA